MLRIKKTRITAVAAVIAAVTAVVVYGSVDPSSSGLMPRCSFKALTGYDCPGCGFQRALHAALNGDIAGAWDFNPFLFFIIPIGLLYAWVEFGSNDKLRRVLMSKASLLILLTATIVWWVARNL